MLYHSLVKLCNWSWVSADPTYLNRILILQKELSRMMTYNDLREQDYSFPSSDPIFFKLEIINIQDIFKIKISLFIYLFIISKFYL